MLIINNTKDPWIPFWTGIKTYKILKEKGYNVEFKTHPGLGHSWKNEDVEKFLDKILTEKREEKGENFQTKYNFARKMIIVVGTIGGIAFLLFIIIKLSIWRMVKK